MTLHSKLAILFIYLLTSLLLPSLHAQDLSKEYKKETIATLSQLMNDFYVFPEVAKATQDHLQAQLQSGQFDQYTDNESFAKALTTAVQSINKDKHMKVMANPPYQAPKQTPQRIVEEKLHQKSRFRTYNGGFHAARVLEGNVGYIDLRGFTYLDQGKDLADAYMKLIVMTDAVIIDLSQNGGGDPAMVQYLCSYFFDEVVHLNSLYFRDSGDTIKFFSLEEVDGVKMVDVPLFVITGERTFSGAEEFSYNMQTQKRATLVGQTTGGGANPGGTRNINEHLSVFIPTGMAINPITNTNWEGVGVIPEITTQKEETFDKAHALAKVAASEYKTLEEQRFKEEYMDLSTVLENHQVGDSDDKVIKSITDAHNKKIINENDINMLGYNYLMEHKKPELALAIFKSNTILFSQSSNCWDSYAECFMMMDDLLSSKKYYQKAVDIATENKQGNVDFYKENLAKVEEMIKTK